MSRTIRALTAVSLLSGAFVACSSFRSDDMPAAADAGGPALPVEAGADVVQVDATPKDGGTAHFCDSLPVKPTLCADFDEGRAVEDNFETKMGAPSVDTAYAKSPPASMLAPPEGWLARTFPGDVKTISLSFAVRVGGDDGGPPLADFGIAARIMSGSAGCQFDLALARRELLISRQVDAAPTEERHSLVHAPAPGEWTDVVIHLADNGMGVTAAVDIGGLPAVATVTTTCPDLKAETDLEIGLFYAGSAGPVRLDDVVFDLH